MSGTALPRRVSELDGCVRIGPWANLGRTREVVFVSKDSVTRVLQLVVNSKNKVGGLPR